MKRISKEIAAIILLAILLAFIVNFLSNKPFPLIYKAPPDIVVSDSLLDIQLRGDSSNIMNDNAAAIINKPVERPSDTIKNNPEKSNNKPGNYIDSSVTGNETKSDEGDMIVKSVNYSQVLKFYDNPKFFLIDARPPEEYVLGKIGNAVNIYPYQEQSEFFRKLSLLPDDKILVVYCEGGNCDLSHIVIQSLSALGFKNIYIYKGGWDEWKIKQKNQSEHQ